MHAALHMSQVPHSTGQVSLTAAPVLLAQHLLSSSAWHEGGSGLPLHVSGGNAAISALIPLVQLAADVHANWNGSREDTNGYYTECEFRQVFY